MSQGDATALPPPPVQWAQRKDRIYLTIGLGDVQEKQLELTETRLVFSGVGGTSKKSHAFTIDFHKEVNPEESRNLTTGREILMSIKKKESGPYWPRLTTDAVKRHWLKTDFNRWVDEDELDARPSGGGGFGGGGGEDDNFEAMMSQFGGGFGGGGGGGGGLGGGFGGEEGDDELDLGDDEELDEGPEGAVPPLVDENGSSGSSSAAQPAKEEGEDGQKAAPVAAAD